MSYELQKQELRNKLYKIKEVLHTVNSNSHDNKINEILQDIENDFYTIVTVGEFKNGKSTFVNALLGEELMPVGVTPTTATINAAMWGEQRQLTVYKKNGEKESKELSKEILEDYIASSTFNPDDISYLQMNVASPLLKNKVVLIDTPGVNDINQLRANVTYQFIPKADAVLFILNLTAPVKKSEYKFLTETILKQGIDRIVFIANFVDRLNEEDISATLVSMEQRLKSIPEFSDIEVLPLSAIEALEGRVEEDEELTEISGLQVIEAKINELISSGSRGNEKLKRYKVRISHLLVDTISDVSYQQSLQNKSKQELQVELDNIETWKQSQGEREEMLSNYISDRQNEINMMVYKSIDHFFDTLLEEIEEQIELYSGNDIGHFIEKQIPNFIKKRLKTWIEKYTPHIHDLLGKLEIEISNGLSQSFEEQVLIRTGNGLGLQYEGQVKVGLGKKGDPVVTSGLLVGGASALALLLGGPILIPIIGMAGLPFLQRKLIKSQLEQIKPKILLETEKQLANVKENFSNGVLSYVDDAIRKIKAESLTQFQEKTDKFIQSINTEMIQKENQLHEDHQYEECLKEAVEELQTMLCFFEEEEMSNERIFESTI
ncbi:dynamin family protein [Cytobacillus suaedae]|nr:dynamin family protein [Cytobacillus suaedae]